jgi:signal transduction histidine kinase
VPHEVLVLVAAINDALSRLSGALEAERAFTAEAAHALRTPLAVLNARIAALPSESGLADIKTDICSLDRLVHQLLSAAQADTLRIGPDRSCDLSAVAEKVVASMAPVAIGQNRVLALESEGETLVRGDADALAHGIRNLVENALRFGPPTSEILVRVRRDGSVSVLDRGPGIPDELKPLATKRFWRAASDLGGTGLGLSIVQRIAEAHGTRLQIQDRPGGGSQFTIQLMLVR